jgi:hypothetical protein
MVAQATPPVPQHLSLFGTSINKCQLRRASSSLMVALIDTPPCATGFTALLVAISLNQNGHRTHYWKLVH